MSKCISRHGEYSEHGPLDENCHCEWCGDLDEAAMRGGVEAAVREQVARELESERERLMDECDESAWANGYLGGLLDAARIARGGTA